MQFAISTATCARPPAQRLLWGLTYSGLDHALETSAHAILSLPTNKRHVISVNSYNLSFSSFFPSHRLSSPYLSRSFPFVTQIRGHIAVWHSFPLPATVRALFKAFTARGVQQLLPSSTRVESCVHMLSRRFLQANFCTRKIKVHSVGLELARLALLVVVCEGKKHYE